MDDVVRPAPGGEAAGPGRGGVRSRSRAGVTVDNITLPFVGAVDFGDAGGVLTLIGLVGGDERGQLQRRRRRARRRRVHDQRRHLRDHRLRPRQRDAAGVLAALTAGAALGFLVHNFHPASIFMGDSGSNLLGLMLGCIAVQGSLKTNALIALVGPLVILAVPFLDTGFVVAKRLKYRRSPGRPTPSTSTTASARIGFSQRRTVLYLYGWTLALAGLALALRFVPYSDDAGHFDARLDAGDGRARPARARGQRVPRLRAGDPQVPPRARAPAARAGPGHRRARDRGERRARGRDRRVRRRRSRDARR